MSREAKIGLLVALAFVLVIGLLLSDHVTVATRGADAQLSMSGQSVRDSTTVPGVRNVGVVLPETPVSVSRPYLSEPAAQQGAEAPDPFGEMVVTRSTPEPAPATNNPSTPQTIDPNAMAEWSHEGQPAAPSQTLEQAAAAAGQPVEAVAQTAAAQIVRVGEYTAKPGDSLGKIARRVLGSDTPQTRTALLKLNPELARNPDLIIAGHTYKVPADASAAVSSTATTPTASSTTPSTASGRTYTVKSGDVLGTIAQKQLGTFRRWKEIIAANPDQLSDEHDLKVGMVLKMPG